MLKNNIKTFIFYIIIVTITFAALLAFNTLYLSSNYGFNNIILKLFFISFYILLFIIGGKIIGTKHRSSTDFFNFLLVFAIGLLFYFLAYIGGGMGFSENMNVLMLPAQIYLSPFILIASIAGIEFNIMYFIFMSIIISLIIGLSIRRSRVKKRYR